MSLKMTWLGSASFLLEDSNHNTVYLDPWLDGEIGNPRCPLKVSDVARADLVLVTHGDQAHYGSGDSVRIAAKTGCRYASNHQLCDFIAQKGMLPRSQMLPLALDERHHLEFMDLTVFPVIHPPYKEPPKSGIPPEPNTGFALSMGGVSTLYTGDTVLGDEVYRRIAAAYSPRVGFLPIVGGTGHGTAAQSVEVAASIAAMTRIEYIIPHYRWIPNNAAMDMLIDATRSLAVEVVRLEPGGSLTL